MSLLHPWVSLLYAILFLTRADPLVSLCLPVSLSHLPDECYQMLRPMYHVDLNMDLMPVQEVLSECRPQESHKTVHIGSSPEYQQELLMSSVHGEREIEWGRGRWWERLRKDTWCWHLFSTCLCAHTCTPCLVTHSHSSHINKRIYTTHSNYVALISWYFFMVKSSLGIYLHTVQNISEIYLISLTKH